MRNTMLINQFKFLTELITNSFCKKVVLKSFISTFELENFPQSLSQSKPLPLYSILDFKFF